MDLYVISGVTGMTGNELSRKLVAGGHRVIGFDNFFASSITTVEDILENQWFSFYEFDINNREQMEMLRDMVREETEMGRFDRVVYINCAAVVHTEHFYHVNRTFETNVLGMKAFLEQAEAVGADTFINCSTSEVYLGRAWGGGVGLYHHGQRRAQPENQLCHGKAFDGVFYEGGGDGGQDQRLFHPLCQCVQQK